MFSKFRVAIVANQLSLVSEFRRVVFFFFFLLNTIRFSSVPYSYVTGDLIVAEMYIQRRL